MVLSRKKMEPFDHVLERKYAEESEIDTDRDERTKQSEQRDGFGKRKRGGGRDDGGVKAAVFEGIVEAEVRFVRFFVGRMDCV